MPILSHISIMICILTPKPDIYNTDAIIQAEWWQMMISLINLDDCFADLHNRNEWSRNGGIHRNTVFQITNL